MNEYTVIIPAYNAALTIEETLQSVIAQTLKPAAIIVVDDGSTDDTAALAQRFAPLVRVLQQENKGPAAATNLGLANVKTPIIAMLDADDLWHPQKMERELAVLASDPKLHLVCSQQRQFKHGAVDDGSGEVRLGLNRSGIILRREVYDRVGDMNDQPGQRGDMIEWLSRVKSAGYRIHNLDEVLSYRRIIPGSLSWGRDPSKDIGYLNIAHAAMKRNRRLKQLNEAKSK
ncbi:MAG: glycosyltransferase family A protein [Bacteroidales bacterium]|jgi:glycosyltransferase involved in cell wall biosynthesis